MFPPVVSCILFRGWRKLGRDGLFLKILTVSQQATYLWEPQKGTCDRKASQNTQDCLHLPRHQQQNREKWAAGMFSVDSPPSDDSDNLVWELDLYRKPRRKISIPLEMVGYWNWFYNSWFLSVRNQLLELFTQAWALRCSQFFSKQKLPGKGFHHSKCSRWRLPLKIKCFAPLPLHYAG